MAALMEVDGSKTMDEKVERVLHEMWRYESLDTNLCYGANGFLLQLTTHQHQPILGKKT